MNKRTLLERFLRDEQLNSKELETIISLLKDGELDDVFEEDLEDLWPTIEMDQIEWDSTTLKNRLFQKIGEKQKPQGNRTSVRTKISHHVSYVGIAASILVLLVAAVLVYTNQSTDDKSSIKQEVVEWVTKSNPVGIKTVVKLQDGSSVYLNAESSIQYPVDFIANRTIELIGEAFFEVAEEIGRAHV
jgi:ferric-dicitrate binding protein FerR (iron transport regulator)